MITIISGPLLVFILRLIVPFSIFRYPLAGGIVSMLLDGLDVVIADVIGVGNIPIIAEHYNLSYHSIDKYLDMYYLSFAFFVSLRWKERMAKMTSVWLFVWRAVGFVLFEVTKLRIFLFFAPNLFENFYLFYLITKHYKPQWEIKTKRRLFIVLFLLYIPKFGQEYLLHVTEAQPWTWFKTKYLAGLSLPTFILRVSDVTSNNQCCPDEH